jgi:4-hydroxy-3-polyprenylbenzoate decarboxylase
MKHLVVVISGASGVCYGLRLLRAVRAAGIEITLLVSRGGARVLEIEEGLRIDPERPDARLLLAEPGDGPLAGVRAVALSDIAATICSGTHPVDAMVVIPCSMGTLGRIVAGVSSNALERSADVMLKEGRPLVLVPRETPLSRIHLDNLLRAHDAGAAIVPASPGFYHRPTSIDELIDQLVLKVLDRLRVPNELIRRWKTPGPDPAPAPADDEASPGSDPSSA